ncbi:hypothetical protein yc1106_00002 [Curvularia clavata]|uniref:Nitroreductase domain-containing protein n=1 Tax=Curvularia clavata TaxID=95742 RepID=A0A9Q9DMU5_CURCL|nr:hypothetical protein yc1106_00002 [Curvularia clavata]
MKMPPTTPFLSAVANRHSNYALLKQSPIPNSRILEIVHHALAYGPSPFNVRSARCLVLFGDHHTHLWQHSYDAIERETPASLALLGPKIKGYQAAYGTLLRYPQVLFFDDAEAVLTLPSRFQALYKQFPEWEEHSSGMHQYIVWTALAAEGLGCNLQHYQKVIGTYLRERYGIQETWRCKAQLVFGSLGDEAYEEKGKTGLAEAMRVYG